MLGTFPKAFSKRQPPKGNFPSGNFTNVQFPKWQLHKCTISQVATSQMYNSQVATSQMYNFPSDNFQVCPSRSARPPSLFISAAASPHCSLRRLRRPNLTLHIREVSSSEKLSLGKSSLGKCLWENT